MTDLHRLDRREALSFSAVLREGLGSIVREMRRAMVRSSYSSIIYEGYDFSCVLTDGAGNLIAESGEDHPFHIIPISGAVAGMTRRHGTIGPDEIVLHNDPYTGGTHLNDVAVIWPVHHNGLPAFHIVIRSHWADIGGMSPGSLNGAATEILQEGLRLDHVRVAKSGADELLRLVFDNVRASREAASDFRTVLGICRVAEGRLRGLLAKYGAPRVNGAVQDILDGAEQRLRRAIAALPDGTWHHTGYLDGAAATPHPLCVRVALSVEGDRILADFTGTTPQVDAPLNAGPAIAPTSVLTVIKSFLDPSGSINSGTLRAITVHAPQGTIVNATPPAPCGGLNEVRFACDAAVMGALGQIAPARLIGDVRGTSNHTYIGSRSFIFYEYPSGGTGASAESDGAVAVRAFNEGENVSIQSAEIVEAIFPLRVLRNEIRPDSGGAGLSRGGCGLHREVEILVDDARLSVLSDRNIVPPAGVNGGLSGAPNRYSLRRDGAMVEPSRFPGKIANFPLRSGDVVVMESSGGGGFGDPRERDPERIAEDLADGYVTQDGLASYSRLGPGPVLALDPDLAAHACGLSRTLAAALDAEPGSLVEVVFVTGPSRRFWVAAIDSAEKTARIRVAPTSTALPDARTIRLLTRRTPLQEGLLP
ncbi:Acetophenone carboxylase delta subunit [Methylobacterium crusticola]|uniref:Acetophenone carboxylase delta subunit n=1 Tax=Methylobacterium crusticola TaxID=1697972 RepID=A0ABQ4R5D3_9HYPH|nr:hydantoinase B/oxoprolinase family protein [Methylobacterium crusticola]GJD52526.1 Acetophenone carboxylase delta subunit [Methylobacterium crusticola]